MASKKKPITQYRTRIALRLMAIKGRGETMERLHRAIESEITVSLRTIQSVAASENEDFIESVNEEESLAIEELLGLGFMAAQSFITSIRTEVVIVGKVYEHEFGSKFSIIADAKAYDALKLAPTLNAAPQFSVVQAINAVANYWKHSEEWPTREEKLNKRFHEVWDQSALRGNEKTTVDIVTALKFKPNSSGNMRTAAKALGITKYDDLSPIRQILIQWAAELLGKARVEFGAADF